MTTYKNFKTLEYDLSNLTKKFNDIVILSKDDKTSITFKNDIEGQIKYSRKGSDIVIKVYGLNLDNTINTKKILGTITYKKGSVVGDDGKISFISDNNNTSKNLLDEYFAPTKNGRNYYGTWMNEAVYSSSSNETFKLGGGNNIIYFPTYFGNDTVKLSKDERLVLNFISDKYTTQREGNDVIISANNQHILIPLGVGYGKEVWEITQENSEYKITISKYSWDYSEGTYVNNSITDTKNWTSEEFKKFQSDNNISLNIGENTLYTRWPVLPNPDITYSNTDFCKGHGNLSGIVRIKDYFKLAQDNVFIGENSLKEILQADESIYTINKSEKTKRQIIKDTFLNETIKGGKGSDIIYTLSGNDNISANTGNDKIIFSQGKKILNFIQGDGKDTLVNYDKADKITLKFNSDKTYFTKSGNDLVINCEYNNELNKITDKIVLQNYFKKINKTNNIFINDEINNLTEKLQTGEYKIQFSSNSTTIKGTSLSDEITVGAKTRKILAGDGNNTINYSENSKKSVSAISGNGNDTFNINNIKILHTISDTGGNDNLNIKADSENDYSIIFDVLSDKANAKANKNSDFTTLSIINNNDNKAFVKIKNYFTKDNDNYIMGNCAIEKINNIEYNNSYFDTIREQVANWLANTDYNTAYEALSKGDETTVKNLIAQYTYNKNN